MNSTALDNLANTAVTMTRAAYSKGVTHAATDGLIRHLSSMLDFEISRQQRDAKVHLDCREGCDSCCHEVVMASVPEILAIYYYILNRFDLGELEALKVRLATYDFEIAPNRDKAYYFGKVACPMLLDHRCSAYEIRPLICRGRNSKDVNACEILKDAPGEAAMFPLFEPQWSAHVAAQQGIMYALKGHLQQGRFELGQCLKMLFDRPGMDAAVIAGRTTFPTPTRAPKPNVFEVRPGDVAIHPPADQNLAVSPELIDAGNFEEVDRILDDSNVLHLFGKLRFPRICDSQEEVELAKSRFSRTLDLLEDMDFDPKVAVAALAFRHFAGLAEQGFDTRDLMARHGRIVVDRITSKVFPHLVAPLDRRKEGKFRVGYLSANLHNNSGCIWALGWLKSHGEEFEIYAFNVGDTVDIVTRRFGEAADHFYQIGGAFQPAAEFIRSLDLDALIFTDLGTRAGDSQFAALRLARAQCTAWGMPMTSGLPTIDYYLCADLMQPAGAQDDFTEKLVRLPNAGLVLSKPKAVIHPKPRSNFGLVEGFLPLMAQTLYKWAPCNDELLARIQKGIGKPIALIAYPNEADLAIFERRMERHSIERQYIPRTDMIGFDRYLQMADVTFDAPTYSGGMSTLRAFAMGTPSATLPGQFMRTRMTAAFNKVAGVEGMNAKNEDDYVDLVVDRDRQSEAMKSLNVEALYEDRSVAEALNAFLLSTAKEL